MRITVFLLFAMIVISGCAHVISDEGRKQVDASIAFKELKQNPEAYVGKVVLVGGKIAQVRNNKEGGTIEVVQFPLDNAGFPLEVAKSAGRFYATSPDFFDPLIYTNNRLVTMTGEVKGKKAGSIDGAEYIFPVIGVKEIFTWKMDEESRGLSSPSPTFYNNYNPYDFSHDVPLWYRPTGPVMR